MSQTHSLATSLDALYRDYNREESASDPVHRVRPFADPVIGRLPPSAPRRWRLAESRASSTRSTHSLPSWGRGPPSTSASSTRVRAIPNCGRWCTAGRAGRTSPRFLWILRQMLESSGSIESFFLDGDDPAAPDVARRSTVSRPARWRSTSGAPTAAMPKRPGVCYFFPRPSAGSACKRLNLFLRWMVAA